MSIPQVTVPQRPPGTVRVPARCGTFLLYSPADPQLSRVPHLCADWHILIRDVERRPEDADDRRLRIVIRSQVTPAEYVPPVDGVFAAGEHTELGRLSGSMGEGYQFRSPLDAHARNRLDV
jgi:hypothetical protein